MEDISGEENNELYAIPLSIVILWCFLYGCISAAALFGNSLVMWGVVVSRRMRTVTNMFIATLALSDFIIGLFAIPFQFQAALLQRWNLPDFMCAFCPFVQVLSVNLSVFTLSAIAIDRYRAVVYPMKPQVSKRRAVWIILFIWTIGVLTAFPTELDYKVSYVNDTVNGGMKPFCSHAGLSDTFRVYYYFFLLVIQYILPLIILSGAYARMTIQLWGSSVPGNQEELRDAIILRNKKKVIKMLVLVVILFSVCWLPLQLYNVLQFFIPSINSYKYINIIWFCFHWLAMSNSCVNPFIYAIYNDKFQREFQTRLGYLFRIFGYCKCKRMQNRTSEESQKCSNDPDKIVLHEPLLTNPNSLTVQTRMQEHISAKNRYQCITKFSQASINKEAGNDTEVFSSHPNPKRKGVLTKSQSWNGSTTNAN